MSRRALFIATGANRDPVAHGERAGDLRRARG